MQWNSFLCPVNEILSHILHIQKKCQGDPKYSLLIVRKSDIFTVVRAWPDGQRNRFHKHISTLLGTDKNKEQRNSSFKYSFVYFNLVRLCKYNFFNRRFTRSVKC